MSTSERSAFRQFRKYFEWDSYTWVKSVELWNEAIDKLKKSDIKFLEIGAGRGGMTAYLDKIISGSGYCTDQENPVNNAKKTHELLDVKSDIQYLAADALDLPFQDNFFDIVIFKSVLGAIGAKDSFKNQERAISEMYRVLKPDGMLLFAENLKASNLHNFLRRKFTSWGNDWRYVNIEEMSHLLSGFESLEFSTTGFLACFSRAKYLNRFLNLFDKITNRFVPESWNYLIYGYAIK